MKRILSVVLASIVLVAAVTACSSGASSSAAPSTASGTSSKTSGPSGTPIKIGIMTMLTGDKANIGFAERDGALMAQADINAAGGILGRPVEVYFGDTRGIAQEGVNALRKLLEQDKCEMILGPGQSGTTIAVASMINEAKVPLIASTATNPAVTVVNGVVQPYVWRICFTDPYQGKVIAEYAINKLKKTKAAILYDVGNDYAIGLNQYFEESFKAGGGTIVSKLAYKTGDVDYRSQLSELKAKDFDCILLPNNYKDIALIAKQMADLGITGKQIMCGDSGMSKVIIDMAGAAFNGATIVSHFSQEDPAIAAFLARYVKDYKLTSTPEPNGVFEYDLMMLAKDVITRAKSTKGEDLQKAINETKDFKMIHCTFTMDPATHNPLNKAATMLQVKDGKQVFIERFSPTGTTSSAASSATSSK